MAVLGLLVWNVLKVSEKVFYWESLVTSWLTIDYLSHDVVGIRCWDQCYLSRDYPEGQSRCNNIVVHRFAESPHETWRQSEGNDLGETEDGPEED